MYFLDRSQAGITLAQKLRARRGKGTVVYALPRGGVPVGLEVAKALGAPLDTIVVCKIGAPQNPEFGIGAIAPGEVVILDQHSIKTLGITQQEVDEIMGRELNEMKRRILAYRSGGYSEGLEIDTALIIDDGLATGVTARAAIESVKLVEKPERVIYAAPICARESAERLRGVTDEVVCLSEVDDLGAIGNWYEDFHQLTDREVTECLHEANPTVTV